MVDVLILTKEEIDAIFEKYDHQQNVCIALYKLVYPDWDKIKQVVGWPKAGKAVSEYLMQQFIRFDRKHHRGRRKGDVRDRGCVAGGLWLSSGFSTLDTEHLYPWEVERAPVIYEEGV